MVEALGKTAAMSREVFQGKRSTKALQAPALRRVVANDFVVRGHPAQGLRGSVELPTSAVAQLRPYLEPPDLATPARSDSAQQVDKGRLGEVAGRKLSRGGKPSMRSRVLGQVIEHLGRNGGHKKSTLG